MLNSGINHHEQLRSQSARSQNCVEDLSITDFKNQSNNLSREGTNSPAMSEKDAKKIHSSFLRSISIIFAVVIGVFLTLSILAYLLVNYLQSSHGDHYFDVEPFQSIHPLYNETNVFYTVREKPRQRIPPVSTDLDKYEFELTMSTQIQFTPFNVSPSNTEEYLGIRKTALKRAVMLMELPHNVNFYGEFVFDHFHYFHTPREKALYYVNLLTQERVYLNSKYQIDKYIHDQIRMCVFVPSFNNAKNRLYLRNIDSIFQQNYKSYHVVYVNDASTDETGEYVQAYMEENEIPQEKYFIINNEKSQLHCANIHKVAHDYCKEGEVLVMLDGDDSLIGRDVFALLNAVYQKQKVAMTYGQFIVVKQNSITGGWSRPIPKQYLENGNFRKLRTFYSSHLKTMYVDLFRKINSSDLQYKNGSFYKYAPDVAYMTPVIQMVGTRLAYINEANYQYRFDTGMNDPGTQQIIVSTQVYGKIPYSKLQTMEFADNPKTTHYDEV